MAIGSRELLGLIVLTVTTMWYCANEKTDYPINNAAGEPVKVNGRNFTVKISRFDSSHYQATLRLGDKEIGSPAIIPDKRRISQCCLNEWAGLLQALLKEERPAPDSSRLILPSSVSSPSATATPSLAG
ncbi:MAG: hypothetical protein WC553_01070 [Patescibacteria group bacterium]